MMNGIQSPLTQFALEHTGIAVAAITGVLAAKGKRIDLFGVTVLALVTAYGGGTVRDVLAGDLPPVWLRTPWYLLNGCVAAAATFFIVRLRAIPLNVLLVADAATLALFTMLGARKGVLFGFTPSVCILLGVVTGVAGGIVRDVLLGEVPLVFRPEIHLYATAALCGAGVYVGLSSLALGVPENTFLSASLVFLLRLAAIRWKISLPMFESR